MGNSIADISIYTHIYLPIGIWLLGVIVLLIGLIIKYPFGKWTVENPNPYSGESLSLPRGTFRSILTLSLLFVTVLLEIFSMANNRSEDNYIEFLVAFKMMIAFYFGAKVAHHVTSTNRHVAKYEADATTVQSTTTGDAGAATTPTNFEDNEAAG